MNEYRNAAGFPVSTNVLVEVIHLRGAQPGFFSSHIQQPRDTSGVGSVEYKQGRVTQRLALSEAGEEV